MSAQQVPVQTLTHTHPTQPKPRANQIATIYALQTYAMQEKETQASSRRTASAANLIMNSMLT